MQKAAVGLFLLMLLPLHLYAQQQDSTESQVQDDIEEALQDYDPENSDLNPEQLTQFLQDLASNPVNLNNAGINQLRRVPGLNFKTARGIIDYRKKKPFETIDELKEVSGIGRVTLEKVRPYVTPGSGLSLGKDLYTSLGYWTNDGQFQAFSRFQKDLQTAEGYRKSPIDGGYVGNNVKYYQRFQYESDHVSVNLTQEKDPGEQLVSPTKFDNRSYHFALKNNGKLKMLVGGDYSLSFGQGLTLWSGATFGKGANVVGAANRSSQGVDPYTSAQETNNYRGAAVTYGGRLQFTGFYSSRRRSATRLAQDTTRFPNNTGYHRTDNELRKKNNLGQDLYGGHVQMELPFGIIGATGYKTTFDQYISASDRTYAQYDFEGRSNSAFGVDYTFLLGPAVIYGEVSRSENGGMGIVSGVESPIGDNTEISVAYRNYQKEFQSILGNGFGEVSGQPKNEEGIYLGLEHTIGDRITVNAYIDQYRFPSARFGTNQPTQGYDWLGKVDVELTDDLNFYVQLRSDVSDDEYEILDPYGRSVRKLGTARRSTYRANLEYWVNSKVRLRTRGELVQSQAAGEGLESGYLIYQDLRLQLTDKLQVDTRLTMFDTDSYASRVYQYENDLLYVFAIQALSDRGQRLYARLKYEPTSYLDFWAKFGLTVYEDQPVIGSGLNQIGGDKRSDLGLEVRLKF